MTTNRGNFAARENENQRRCTACGDVVRAGDDALDEVPEAGFLHAECLTDIKREAADAFRRDVAAHVATTPRSPYEEEPTDER